MSSDAYRLSTEMFPERERIAFWREEFGRVILRLDVDPIGDEPFRADSRLRALAGLSMFSGVCSRTHYLATPSIVANNSDDICIIQSADPVMAKQLGRESTLAAGDATMLSWADPFSYLMPAGGYSTAVRLSRPVLQALAPGLNDLYNRAIPAQNAALRLLFSYLRVLEDQQTLSTAEQQHVVVTHIYDLAALALGASRDSAEMAKERGLRAARLRAIKEDIAARLSEPGLSLESLALRHKVSPRYVQKLFELEGTSFSDFVRAKRLARTWRMLQDPRLSHQSISTIAYECGFGDITAFNRAFRRHYSASPSDVRHPARGF